MDTHQYARIHIKKTESTYKHADTDSYSNLNLANRHFEVA